MVSYAAALLDELMGANRDSKPTDINRKPHWSDEKFCKYFIAAFCPNDLFINTRADLGRCTKIHDEEFRLSYQKSSRFGKVGYERDALHYLQMLENDIENKIRRAEQKLIQNTRPVTGPIITASCQARITRITELTQMINTLVSEAEALGEEGKVDESQALLVKSDQLKLEKNSLTVMNEREMLMVEQEIGKVMEVCKVCGAYLVVGDPQQRQDEHATGKLHMGYAKIRAYVKEQDEKRKLEDELERIKSSSINNKHDETKKEGDPEARKSSSRSRSKRSRSKRTRSRSKSERSKSRSRNCSRDERSRESHRNHSDRNDRQDERRESRKMDRNRSSSRERYRSSRNRSRNRY